MTALWGLCVVGAFLVMLAMRMSAPREPEKVVGKTRRR